MNLKQNAFYEGKNTIINELTFIYLLPGGNFIKAKMRDKTSGKRLFTDSGLTVQGRGFKL